MRYLVFIILFILAGFSASAGDKKQAGTISGYIVGEVDQPQLV